MYAHDMVQIPIKNLMPGLSAKSMLTDARRFRKCHYGSLYSDKTKAKLFTGLD
jgi:hypothetical protein